jgi:phospholipid/cholesterol/gamma-HCH transport system substrate-binding protein
MSRNAVETVMGAVVLVVAAVFLYFAYTTSQVQAGGGYDLTARFDRIDGIRAGTDVRISGVKVGTVVSQTLDPKTFLAIVVLNIDTKVKLPKDTVAHITSSSLLGDNYVLLEPGNEDAIIPPGGVIERTQPPMNLEQLIGQYLFSQSGKKESGDGSDKPK